MMTQALLCTTIRDYFLDVNNNYNQELNFKFNTVKYFDQSFGLVTFDYYNRIIFICINCFDEKTKNIFFLEPTTMTKYFIKFLFKKFKIKNQLVDWHVKLYFDKENINHLSIRHVNMMRNIFIPFC